MHTFCIHQKFSYIINVMFPVPCVTRSFEITEVMIMIISASVGALFQLCCAVVIIIVPIYAFVGQLGSSTKSGSDWRYCYPAAYDTT